MRSDARALLVALALAACGGGGDDAANASADSALAAAGNTAAANAAADDSLALAPGIAFDTAAARGERPLLREVYDWRGGGRDPFRPLVVQEVGGPEMVDLILTSVLYQPSNPDRSVAIFRDTGNNRRYTVGPGDRIGRLTVVSIGEGTARLRMNDFGTVREQTFTLRRQEDGTP
jgi:hypothetical protein